MIEPTWGQLILGIGELLLGILVIGFCIALGLAAVWFFFGGDDA